MNTAIFSWVGFAYLAAGVLPVLSLFLDRKSVNSLVLAVSAAGFAGHTIGLGLRWFESYAIGAGHAPLSNFYESLVFFAWTVVLFSLIIRRRFRKADISAFFLLTAFSLMAYASFSPDVSSRIQPLVPALKSNWMISHVVTCFLGYAAFVIASGYALFYLLTSTGKDRPGRVYLEEIIHRCIAAGFIFFTLGIMTGSIWAHYAWGRYWGWDPKETWALITWLIFAAALHARRAAGWSEKGMAVLTLVGLISILITYVGVNRLAGLHSYLG